LDEDSNIDYSLNFKLSFNELWDTPNTPHTAYKKLGPKPLIQSGKHAMIALSWAMMTANSALRD
jgi:hypothetical protein